MNRDDRSIEQEIIGHLEEAEALIWGLLDENIDAADFQRLERLLTNKEVRDRYLQCVELHSDLRELFGETADDVPSKPIPKSPVLGFLGDSLPPYPETTPAPPITE